MKRGNLLKRKKKSKKQRKMKEMRKMKKAKKLTKMKLFPLKIWPKMMKLSLIVMIAITESKERRKKNRKARKKNRKARKRKKVDINISKKMISKAIWLIRRNF